MTNPFSLCAVFFVLGVTVGHYTSEGTNYDSRLRDANTATIMELGAVAAVMYDNTDTMMRYSHYTEGHSVALLACPECGDSDADHMEPDALDAEYADTKPDQNAIEDARELTLSVSTLRNHLVNQGVALRYTLEQLRKEQGTK
jgi:hypothetical protein